MMRRVLIVTVAGLALAACNKGGAGKAPAPGAPAAGSAAAGLATPTRKAGLWQITMTRDGQPMLGPMGMGPVKTCVDASTEQGGAIFSRRMARGLCPQMSSSRGLDGSYSFSSTCNMGPGGTVKTSGTAKGDFSSQYTVHAETDVEGPPDSPRNGHHVMDTTATYVGPCPSGMAGGDIQLPNGSVINPEKMAEAWRAARQGQGGAATGGDGDGGGPPSQ
ncbi:MAG TPA: DUF3617 family protein [Caulobacteraceae bacterium]|nr:DUF3617 family protein [Caulobacteraceae bacterium]